MPKRQEVEEAGVSTRLDKNDNDTDTDTKLALLASLLEPATFPISDLLEALQAAHGDIAGAAEGLLIPRVKSAGKRKAGSSLASWLGKKRGGADSDGGSGVSTHPAKAGHSLDVDLKREATDVLDGITALVEADRSCLDQTAKGIPATPSSAASSSRETKPPADLMTLLRQPVSPSKPRNPARPPIPLPSQKAIDTHNLPMTLLRSPISPALASALYLTMMDESETWERNRFYLAGKWVESPHTVCHYSRNGGRYDERAELASKIDIGDMGDAMAFNHERPEAKTSHETEEKLAKEKFVRDAESLEGKDGKKATYMWSGQEINPPREYPELLKQVADLVEPLINASIRGRSRYPLEWAGDWKATICGTNRYDGAGSGVGWHADQMTYLGPYCTIASLSLGTPRAFRLRPTDTVDASYASSSPARTYEVTLGHNSLVLMNAGCQERYKHTVPTQKALDLFRPTFDKHQQPIPPDQQKTYTARINITFRFHRPDFHPLPETAGPFGPRQGTPYCKCGIPTLLRADQKAKARARLPNTSPTKTRAPSSDTMSINAKVGESASLINDDMLFFWQCQSPGQTGDMKGCGFFRILDMRQEGRGPCVNDAMNGRWAGVI